MNCYNTLLKMDPTTERVLAIAGGIPGALKVLGAVYGECTDAEFVSFLDRLEGHSIRGSTIWVMYNECGSDSTKFMNQVYNL